MFSIIFLIFVALLGKDNFQVWKIWEQEVDSQDALRAFPKGAQSEALA